MPLPDYMNSFRPDPASAAADKSYLKGFQPDSRDMDSATVAQAASAAPSPQAAKAVTLAGDLGVSPKYVAAGQPEAQAASDKRQFAAQLRGRPALTAWAQQSPQHAAAVRDDAGILGHIEGWFSDMGNAFVVGAGDILHAEAMREYMGKGGPLAKDATSLEAGIAEYDQTPRSFPEHLARALPQVIAYGVTGKYTGTAGIAGLLYAQNKGVLARQIQLTRDEVREDDRPEVKVVGKDGVVRWKRFGPERLDDQLTDEEIDKYASAGSSVAAVAVAGLLGPVLRTIPGIKSSLQQTAASILTRAAMTTVGQAAIRNLSAYGVHTAMGALGMTLQAVINSETARMAAKQDADPEQLAREAASTFAKILPIAATFAAFGPGREFLEDRARINGAPLEVAKMDDMVKWAKQAALVKHSPQLATELFGEMGRGAMAYINHEAAAKMEGLDPAKVAAAEVAQGDVAVPLPEYLTKHLDEHDSIRDDVKLSPDGMTMNEARARDKEMREALTPEQARALYGRLTPDELQNIDMPIAADLSPGMARNLNFLGKQRDQVRPLNATINGRTGGTLDAKVPTTDTASMLAPGAAAETNVPGGTAAALMPLHEVMAKEYGGKADDWVKKLSPELMAALNEEGHVGALSPEEHAARVIEALPIDAIDPKPYDRLAKKSSKYIQEAAEKARSGSAAGAKASSPRDVAILQTYEMARDVNLAKSKKAAEVAEEMAKTKEDLAAKAVNQKLRAQMQLAGGPVLRLFDSLTEGSSASPLRQAWVGAHEEAVSRGMERFSAEATKYADDRMAGALDEAQQWFRDNARPFEFNVDALRTFLSKPKPWGELLPAQARNIADAVKQLVKAAREETIVRRENAEATVREAADEIRGELAQNPSKGLPKPTGIPTTWWEDRMLDANAANAIQLRPKNNLRQKSIAAVKWIFDNINSAVYARDDYFRDVGGLWKAARDDIPAEVAARQYETYDLSDRLPTPGMEPLVAVPRRWLWKMARHRMSAGNMERVTSTSGWDASTIDHILFDDPKTKLTVAEWDYLQKQADVNEKYVWPKLKEHFEKFYGMAPPKVAGVPFRVELPDGTFKDYAGGYEPLKRDARPGVATQAEPTQGISQYWGRDFQIPSTPGSAKDRVDNSHYLVNMDWDSGRATIAQTLHWLAFDQPVRNVAKLLNDQLLSADMNQYMGQGRADMTRAWLKTSATQQVQSIPEGMEIVSRAFGWQRRLQLVQVIGGSARLAAAQLSHPFGLMLGGEVNPLHGIPALLSIFKPFTAADGEVRLLPNWSDAILHSKEVQHRAENAYNVLRNGWDNAPVEPGPLGALRDFAQKTAGLYLHAVDRLTTTWAWTSFHNEAVAKFKMEPLSTEAVNYANGRTQDVMPVHDVETAAPVLTNRQVGGFLIMHGFKSTLYNMRQDALAASVKDIHLAEGPVEMSGAIARTVGRTALQIAMLGGFAVMGKFALGHGQQKDETKGQWLARDFLAGQTADLPLVGGLGEPLAKIAVGGKVSKHDFTVYGNPGVAAVVKAQELLGSLVNGHREDYKKVFDAVEAALFFLGAPSRAPRVSGENVYKLVTGEGYDDAEDTLGDKTGKFFYTDKQWESIKRSLTPDED